MIATKRFAQLWIIFYTGEKPQGVIPMNEIFHRTSVRKYTDTSVDRDTIEQILRAGMQAPSAVNQQPCIAWATIQAQFRGTEQYTVKFIVLTTPRWPNSPPSVLTQA